MRAEEWIVEKRKGNLLARLYLEAAGTPVLRVKNPSGWSVPENAMATYLGQEMIREAFSLLRSWIQSKNAGCKPLWQALRDSE